MAKKYIFDEEELEQQQASREQVEQARGEYPKTPEHFKRVVEQAVAAQYAQQDSKEHAGEQSRKIEKQVLREKDDFRKNGKQISPEEKDFRQIKKARRKKTGNKGWKRFWIPLAATLALGGAAVAAGSFLLKPYLTEKGFSEDEAEQIIVTEPQQQVTELENMVYPSGQVKEKDWQEPLLKVTEAYFDGNSLYFIGEASEEAEEFELYLRDHASINGNDGLTTLQKLEENSLYLGRIELADKSVGTELLEAETVEVEMTAIAYAKYEGPIFYTWMDSEVYDEIYGIGAFQSEYAPNSTCYALPMEDVINGYTPHKITMQISMTEEAKEIIEKYIADGKMTWDNQLTDGGPADQVEAEAAEETTNADMPGAGETTNADVADQQEETEDWEQWICADANVTQRTENVYLGTLKAEPMDSEAVQSLYTAGDPEQWIGQEANQETNQWGHWQYQDQHIFASTSYDGIHYENNELSETGGDSLDNAEPGQEIAFCEQILQQLGWESIVKETKSYEENLKYFQTQVILEGLPVAWDSQWPCAGSMCLENGALSYMNAPAKLRVLEKEEAKLLDMEKIQERAVEYLTSKGMDDGWEIQPLKEISLEYYVDLTREGLIFRPVWNFQYTANYEDGMETELFFYIDAVTGAMIRDTTGYR